MNKPILFIIVISFLSSFLLNSCVRKEIPMLITMSVTDLHSTNAICGGNITDDGNSQIIARGVCWSTSTNPTVANDKTIDGTGIGSFFSLITGFSTNTLYFVRAYATNSLGTAYGNEVTFQFNALLPTLRTTLITSITNEYAFCGGIVTHDGGSPITTRGVCWNTFTNPTITDNKTNIGTGIGNFEIPIYPPSNKITYYVRAFATNSVGTAYGNEESFRLLPISISEIIFNPNLSYGSVNDIDGNFYKTILIGTQIWMAENLKTTKYNNGTDIPLVKDITEWSGLSTPGYVWYHTDTTYKNTYGALYNWYTVNTGNLCPTGWHVPSDAEWTTLISYLGSNELAGGKLKENGTSHWVGPNYGASNETGFSALPSGFCYQKFYRIGTAGHWWSITQINVMGVTFASYYTMQYSDKFLSHNKGLKKLGNSVRCLKD